MQTSVRNVVLNEVLMEIHQQNPNLVIDACVKNLAPGPEYTIYMRLCSSLLLGKTQVDSFEIGQSDLACSVNPNHPLKPEMVILLARSALNQLYFGPFSVLVRLACGNQSRT